VRVLAGWHERFLPIPTDDQLKPFEGMRLLAGYTADLHDPTCLSL